MKTAAKATANKGKASKKGADKVDDADEDAMDGVEEAAPAEGGSGAENDPVPAEQDRNGRPSKRTAAKDVSYNDAGPALKGSMKSKAAKVCIWLAYLA